MDPEDRTRAQNPSFRLPKDEHIYYIMRIYFILFYFFGF